MAGHGLDLLTLEERHLILRQDFATFIAATFCHLNPTTPFAANWHIDLIASKLEACRTGRIKRLIINIPPRNLKSICASIALPAFWLGHNPSAQIICVSYAQDLSNKLSMDCRDVMASPWYQELFATRLSRTRMAVEEFTTTRQGFRKATSVGGVITGRGAIDERTTRVAAELHPPVDILLHATKDLLRSLLDRGNAPETVRST